MRQITLREFQLHPTKQLEKLPFIITRSGEEVAQVSSLDGQPVNKPEQKPVNSVQEQVATDSTASPDDITSYFVKPPAKTARCQAPNSNCRNTGRKSIISFYQSEGENKKELFLCDLHVKKAREQEMEVAVV